MTRNWCQRTILTETYGTTSITEFLRISYMLTAASIDTYLSIDDDQLLQPRGRKKLTGFGFPDSILEKYSSSYSYNE